MLLESQHQSVSCASLTDVILRYTMVAEQKSGNHGLLRFNAYSGSFYVCPADEARTNRVNKKYGTNFTAFALACVETTTRSPKL